jgi:hypothetical protein
MKIIAIFAFLNIIMMKIKQFLTFFLLLTLAISSCETEFDLDAPFKDYTIVYGLLEMTEEGEADSAFIKITRAFLGGDASQVAQIEDSSEYQEKLDVTLTRYRNGNLIGDPIVFDTITRNNKDTIGDFYAPRHQMYYAIMQVDEESKYELRIVIGNKVVTSETYIVNPFSIKKPGQAKLINYIPGSPPMTFEWVVSEYAKSYEAIIRFYFKEVWEGMPDTVYRYIDWYKFSKVNESVSIGNTLSLNYPADLFYTSVTNTVPYFDAATEARVLARYSGRAEYIVFAATEELTTYVNVNNTNSNSIVLERPEYTNINNGFGIFSSRRTETTTKTLSNDTKDLLSNLGVKFEY